MEIVDDNVRLGIGAPKERRRDQRTGRLEKSAARVKRLCHARFIGR
jgi:hypothetical protein